MLIPGSRCLAHPAASFSFRHRFTLIALAVMADRFLVLRDELYKTTEPDGNSGGNGGENKNRSIKPMSDLCPIGELTPNHSLSWWNRQCSTLFRFSIKVNCFVPRHIQIGHPGTRQETWKFERGTLRAKAFLSLQELSESHNSALVRLFIAEITDKRAGSVSCLSIFLLSIWLSANNSSARWLHLA